MDTGNYGNYGMEFQIRKLGVIISDLETTYFYFQRLFLKVLSAKNLWGQRQGKDGNGMRGSHPSTSDL